MRVFHSHRGGPTPIVRAVPIVLVALALGMAAGRAIQAAEPEVILTLASGREFTGIIDAQTSDESLVLRSTLRGVTIRRPIDWPRIASATLNGQKLTIEELKERAAGDGGQGGRGQGGPEQGTGDRGQGSGVNGAASEVEEEELAPPAPGPLAGLPRVTTVAFDARIANWDADVETDGLVLELLPLDGEGYLRPVSGTVEIELFAPQRRVFHHAPLSGGDTLERVERWTRTVRSADFTANGIRLRLPFGAIHPEFDSAWFASSYGLVHVRLAAPGHGTFDASRDAVRIRPWAPNRDQLELNTNRRFVPTEAVGRRD